MKIIITMAGQGSRFRKAGVNKPKHEIIANGKTLFEWSMMTLVDFFDEEFIFIVRAGQYDREQIEQLNRRLKINNYHFVEIQSLTDGQGRTVQAAEKWMQPNDDFVIYNIDTYIQHGVVKKAGMAEYDGFLPLFVAEGAQWSFAKIDPATNKIIEVAEKKRISNLGTIGLYYFGSWQAYNTVITRHAEEIKSQFKELYIAPMYNYLIAKGKSIGYSVIADPEIINLGTPTEVVAFAPQFMDENLDQK